MNEQYFVLYIGNMICHRSDLLTVFVCGLSYKLKDRLYVKVYRQKIKWIVLVVIEK